MLHIIGSVNKNLSAQLPLKSSAFPGAWSIIRSACRGFSLSGIKTKDFV